MLDIQAIHLLRSIQKTAHILLLLLMLDRPTGETEIAGILGLSPTTARAGLASLARIGLACREDHKNGYLASPAARVFIFGNPTGKILPVAPITTIMLTNDSISNLIEVIDPTGKKTPVGGENGAGVDNSPESGDKPVDKSGENSSGAGPPGEPEIEIDPELGEALRLAGITLNPRTRKLLELPHMTAEYVRRHHAALVKIKKGRETGLLITILESGAPPYVDDPLHPTGCSCRNCRSKYNDWLKPSREFDGS
jgi:hypothetical protein